MDVGADTDKILIHHRVLLISITDNPKDNIPRIMYPVNKMKPVKDERLEKLGVINAAPNQAAEIFSRSPAREMMNAFWYFL